MGWTDDPLTQQHLIKHVHINELVQKVNQELRRRNLEEVNLNVSTEDEVETEHIEILRRKIEISDVIRGCHTHNANIKIGNRSIHFTNHKTNYDSGENISERSNYDSGVQSSYTVCSSHDSSIKSSKHSSHYYGFNSGVNSSEGSCPSFNSGIKQSHDFNEHVGFLSGRHGSFNTGDKTSRDSSHYSNKKSSHLYTVRSLEDSGENYRAKQSRQTGDHGSQYGSDESGKFSGAQSGVLTSNCRHIVCSYHNTRVRTGFRSGHLGGYEGWDYGEGDDAE